MPPAAVLAMVMIVNPPRMHPVSIGAFGSALASGAERSGGMDGLVGGGLAVSFHVFGPYGEFKLWFAVDARVRLLDDLASSPNALRLPIDLLVRTTLVPSYTVRPEPCTLPPNSPPEAICLGVDREEPFPLQPYVSVGGTVDVPVSAGDTRGGPIGALGLQWFLDERFSLFLEAEARALFGGANVYGQVGLNLGFLVGP